MPWKLNLNKQDNYGEQIQQNLSIYTCRRPGTAENVSLLILPIMRYHHFMGRLYVLIQGSPIRGFHSS